MRSSVPPGTTIGNYRIEAPLGRGGMGAVYLARHVHMDRNVALKLLSPELADDEGFRKRFVGESRVAGSLDHPNIVQVYDAGEQDGQLYIAMRYVQGRDLGTLLQEEGSLPVDRVMAIMEQAASGLDAAHEQGLVHRDVKPGNLLVLPGERDRVFVSDFGLTKRVDVASGLTRTGQIVGTLRYVAPEQLEGRTVDRRTDVYALGCVMFETLTGAPPYAADSEAQVIFGHLMQPPPRATERRPELPAGVDAVVARAMAKDPADRYETCGAMVAALRSAVEAARGPDVEATTVSPVAPPPPAAESPSKPPPPPDTGPFTPPIPTAPEPPTLAPTEARTPEPEHGVGAPIPEVPRPGGARGGRGRVLAIVGAVVGVLALGVIAFLVFAGGASEFDRVAGEYQARDDPSARLTLGADGTWTNFTEGETERFSGTYTVSGDRVTLTVESAEVSGRPSPPPTDEPQSISGTIIENGNAIRFNDPEGGTFVVERRSPE